MRLRAWANTNDFNVFRVHPNKWLEYQYRSANIIKRLELRHDYTEKLIVLDNVLLTKMRRSVEPNGELYDEYHWVTRA